MNRLALNVGRITRDLIVRRSVVLIPEARQKAGRIINEQTLGDAKLHYYELLNLQKAVDMCFESQIKRLTSELNTILEKKRSLREPVERAIMTLKGSIRKYELNGGQHGG